MTPTPEQQAIIEAATSSQDNLLISALAGAAKTTTLEMVCRAMPAVPILSIAFNKRIAEEMQKRLPSNARAQTVNSIGHRVWANATGKRLVLAKDKTYSLVKGLVDSLGRSDRSDIYDFGFSELTRAVAAAKICGYIPEGKFPTGQRLSSSAEFYDSFEEPFPALAQHIVETALTESIKLAFAGQIDFDDQIYMPTLFGGSFPRFPLVMVDEAQDLSPLNHAMLERLVTNRLIAVGDPWQSIYAFRGADRYSMERLQQRFSMKELPLSVSFRCPIEIVKRARFRAPHMQWPEWAKPGKVETLDLWSASNIPDGAAIICRNNGPLFVCALALLRAGRGVHLVGTDLGPSLLRALRKLGPPEMSQSDALIAVEAWKEERLKKTKNKSSVADRAECLKVFVSFGKDLREAINYAEHLFSSRGPVQLLSGHKAKGLEWDNVFHLDPWRIPSRFAESPAEIDQELNVRYVIETRSRENLFLVDMENFNG